MTNRFRNVRHLALAAGLAAACGGMQDEADLQQQLATEFRTPDTNLKRTNGAVLTVTLYNSPLANPPASARRETCRRVAEFVRDHYRDYKYLQAVQVAFGSKRGSVAVTSSGSQCRFTTSDLGPAPTGGAG